MDLDRIKEILKIVSESGVAEVEVEDENFRMVVRQHLPQEVVTYQTVAQQPHIGGSPPPPSDTSTPAMTANAELAGLAEGEVEVLAPIVGTYYSAPSPDADTYVSVGDVVNKGDILCIIEAMKLMNEIESEIDGVVKSILVTNAQPVQYNEALFVIEASSAV